MLPSSVWTRASRRAAAASGRRTDGCMLNSKLMVRVLAVVILLLTGVDHWTTYLCLRLPIAGWDVVEANPIAEWLFDVAGLLPGLALDSLVTLGAIGFLLTTSRFAVEVKLALLAFIAVTTGYAVINNVAAMSDLGISALGVS